MKRKTLTMILCLLTVLSVVGVGFASWVISAGDTNVATGNIQVDTVEDERFTFTQVPNAEEVYFGMKADNSIPSNFVWLKNDTVGKAENLDVSFDITLNSGQNIDQSEAAWAAAVTVSGAYALATDNSSEGIDAYNAAKAAYAFIEPTVTVAFKEATSDKSAVYTVTVKFAWGEAFDKDRATAGTKTGETFNAVSISDDDDATDNLNPYSFYNAVKKVDEVDTQARSVKEWGDDAFYYLDLIEQLDGKNLKYNVTVSATPNN